jgi:hypothetical protein
VPQKTPPKRGYYALGVVAREKHETKTLAKEYYNLIREVCTR